MLNMNYIIVKSLTSKEQMVFFEFWSRSHGISLQPIFLAFLELVLVFEIYPGM